MGSGGKTPRILYSVVGGKWSASCFGRFTAPTSGGGGGEEVSASTECKAERDTESISLCQREEYLLLPVVQPVTELR
jgi:hypothetical protein